MIRRGPFDVCRSRRQKFDFRYSRGRKKTVRINGTQSTRPFGNLRLSADCVSFNCSRIVFDCVAGFDAGLERLHFSFQPLETFFHELRDSCHRRDVRLDGGVEQDSTSCISLR